jgi:hypothetical protein
LLSVFVEHRIIDRAANEKKACTPYAILLADILPRKVPERKAYKESPLVRKHTAYYNVVDIPQIFEEGRVKLLKGWV